MFADLTLTLSSKNRKRKINENENENEKEKIKETKSTFLDLDNSALTSISDFFLSSEVVTAWQTDSTAHKLKPRLFHKSAHL